MSQPDYGQVLNAITGNFIRPAEFMDLVESLFGKNRIYFDRRLNGPAKVQGENDIAHEQACAYLSQGG